MIKDSIANAKLYYRLSPGIERALAYLENLDKSSFEEHTEYIDGENVYAMFQEYETGTIENRSYEAHEKYIDLQFVFAGEEEIRVADREVLKQTTEYNSVKDFSFYEISGGTDLALKKDDFTILFPHDAHIPQLRHKTSGPVKKIVIKIAV